MASRSLYDLQPVFRTRVEMWLDRCKPAGLDILVYCTLRSLEEQAMLYAQGRTRPGPGVTKSRPMGRKVTDARPGQSAHNFGLALDFVPLSQGKPQWSNATLYNTAINLAEPCGLESLRASKFPELAHLQMPGWRGFVPTN